MSEHFWNKLSPELRIRALRLLTVEERARLACASKRTQKEVTVAAVIVPGIFNARISEPLGRALATLLDMMRYATVAIGVCKSLSPRCKQILRSFNDIEKVYEEYSQDLLIMNAEMYTYLEYDFSGEPNTGVLNYASRVCEMNPGTPLEDLPVAQAKYFTEYRITGNFHILLERPDGTIVISEDLKKVYLVQGLSDSLAGLARQNGSVTLPQTGTMTFVPYHGHIVHDGMLLGCKRPANPLTTKYLYRVYAEAANKGEIITSIPLPSAQEVAAMKLAASQKETMELSPYYRSLQIDLKANSKIADEIQGKWFFCRHGCTEQRNPQHLITIVTGSRRPVLMGATTAAVKPTAEEILELLCDAVLEGEGHRPHTIVTDEVTIMSELRALLKPVDIDVVCFPPPTPNAVIAPGMIKNHCAMCGIPAAALKFLRGSDLLQCGRCRVREYCSRECQKQHWKKHKKDCGKM